jgi:hypothetical protein
VVDLEWFTSAELDTWPARRIEHLRWLPDHPDIDDSSYVRLCYCLRGRRNRSCGGSFPLSTTGQKIASGAEGYVVNSYAISLTFTLAESRRYVANSSCAMTLIYSVNAIELVPATLVADRPLTRKSLRTPRQTDALRKSTWKTVIRRSQ